MKLYDMQRSGNAYKIRLFLAFLGLAYEKLPVDLQAGENQHPDFLRLNPRGQIPVLVDGEQTIWDSQAILVYLARQYADPHWLPTEAVPMAQVMQWMAVAENELLFGLARARAAKHFRRPWNFEQCQAYGRSGLQVMDNHLQHRQWLATDQPTIADVACYPYVSVAPEAEINLGDYLAVQQWLRRVEALPGYVVMVND